MSLFGQGTSAPSSGSGTSSLFPNLNLQVPRLDASGRKRSIFDAGTTTSQPPSSGGLFGGLGGTSTSAQPSAGSTAASAPAPFSFGNPTTTSAPSSSGMFRQSITSGPSSNLFGSTATPTPRINLFGSTTTTSAPSSTLFGATTTTAPSTNLFGTTTTTSGPSTSLFGGLGSGTTQSAPGAGMFTTTQQPPQLNSLFGAPSQSVNQAQASTQQQDGSSQIQNRDPAYFRSLLERQKRKGRMGDNAQSVRSSQLPSLNVDLGDLARRAQEIGASASTPSKGADSRAHYLLAGSGVAPGKAYHDFRELADEETGDAATQEPDFGAEDSRLYLQGVQERGREAMMKESMARVYREVDAFIQETLQIDFEEQQQRIMEHFGIIPRSDDDVDGGPQTSPGPRGSFARSGRKSKPTPGKTSARSIFGRSALDKSLIGSPGMNASTSTFFAEEQQLQLPSSLTRGQTARDLRDKERLYIEVIGELNKARTKGETYPIMGRFAAVEESAGEESPKQLADSFRALSEIVKEDAIYPTHSGVREREYSTTYLNEDLRSPAQVRFRKQIIDGSRRHLEKAFYRELESLVEKNPREAQLGGRPTVTNKIRAYIRVRAIRRDLASEGAELQRIGDSGEYCWILIFYLLRSGYLKEAQEYVENDPAFQSTDKRFISYLKSYCISPERRLSRKLQEMINGEYHQRSKMAPTNTIDPYRLACYKIIGRCDLSSRNLDNIGQGVEDWVWLQFSLARETDGLQEHLGDDFGLSQICETITEIGQRHFKKDQVDSSGGYGTYFLMQIMAGMFEQAVDYLHSFNPTSAVHFAVALSYYGLIRVSDYSVAGNELLTHTTTQQSQINFVPLVAYYTASFRTALPVAAVEYLTLICLNSDLKPSSLGRTHVDACHECLRQLCLETREFARLLGDIRTDGSRILGAIEEKQALIKIESHDDFVKAVTLQAAAIANERGQIADAVLLYHLSEDYENVVNILNHALADAICLDLGELPMQLQPLKPRREQEQMSPNSSRTVSDGPQSSLSLTQSTTSPVELARNMIGLYNKNASYYNLISSQTRDTCGALLQLLSARADLESEPPQFMGALEQINDLNILPLQARGSIPKIRAAASAFGSLPPLLARCAGVSVVWAVRAIGGERDNMMAHGSWDAGFGGDRDAMKEQLNAMAKDLMVFAGLVKYKLPGRVYDLLTKAGGDVGAY